MTELTTIDGVGPALAEQLQAAGFETAEDVRDADVDSLVAVKGIGETSARGMIEGDVETTRGRPARLVQEPHILEEIKELAELPISDKGVIRLSGIGWTTHREWKNKYPEYEETFNKHRAEAERKLAEEVARNRPEFLLERAFGYTKEQDVNVSGDGFDLTLSREEKEQLDETFDRDPQ